MSKRRDIEEYLGYVLMCLHCGEYEYLNNFHLTKNKRHYFYGNHSDEIYQDVQFNCRVCNTINHADKNYINIKNNEITWKAEIIYDVTNNITSFCEVNTPHDKFHIKPGFVNRKRFKKLLLFS